MADHRSLPLTDLSEDEILFRDTVRSFAEEKIKPQVSKMDQEAKMPRDLIDACFELGNTATECEFTPEMTEAWTEAYFGELRRSDLARVRLQSLCSEYGWSLWGFIQAASSPIDYDFHAWGMHRFDKAARAFTGPDFTRLLEEVNDRG